MDSGPTRKAGVPMGYPRTPGVGHQHPGDTRPALLPSVEGLTSEGTGIESRMSEIFKDGRISHS